MNYIVFDLEWNQCPYGKERENPELPFEIIEIGAVKMNEEKEILDTFHALVRPVIYPVLHFQTSRVVGITNADLKKGVRFRDAAEDFLKWCGSPEDCLFCTWGTQDLEELQRNLLYYKMLDLLPGPIRYEDVQKLFAIHRGTKKERRSLSFAVEALGIPETGSYHFALEDASYTAKVLQTIPDEIISEYYSIDCFQNPKTRKDEIRIRYANYEKYISREFPTREAVMEPHDVTAVRCFVCGRNVPRVLNWFTDGSGHNHIAIGKCPEHGLVKCKIRVRESFSGRFYAIRTTRQITGEEASQIRKKQAYHRLRKSRKSRGDETP